MPDLGLGEANELYIDATTTVWGLGKRRTTSSHRGMRISTTSSKKATRKRSAEMPSVDPKDYQLDSLGFLKDFHQWDEGFAEAMAPQAGIEGGLGEDHWRVAVARSLDGVF